MKRRECFQRLAKDSEIWRCSPSPLRGARERLGILQPNENWNILLSILARWNLFFLASIGSASMLNTRLKKPAISFKRQNNKHSIL